MTRQFVFAVMVAAVLMGCKNKVEDRIAGLDSQPVLNAAPVEAVPAEPVKPDGPLPSFQFETTNHDFGTITEGDVVEYVYHFTNNGEAPLVIQEAHGSCGCTIPEWTKEAIPVGGKGIIKAKFNSSGKHDKQQKTITITANTFPAQTTVNFTAMVKEKAK